MKMNEAWKSTYVVVCIFPVLSQGKGPGALGLHCRCGSTESSQTPKIQKNQKQIKQSKKDEKALMQEVKEKMERE